MKKLLIAGMLGFLATSASAGVLGIFSAKSVEYVKARISETRGGYTMSFDGTSGGSLYLPLRWTKGPRVLEMGAGYHLQEGGNDKPFLYAGADVKALYRATIKKWLNLGEYIEGPDLPSVYLSTWVNSYQGGTWVVGSETGVQASVELLSFGEGG